jgi:hypothetical protein
MSRTVALELRFRQPDIPSESLPSSLQALPDSFASFVCDDWLVALMYPTDSGAEPVIQKKWSPLDGTSR